MIDVESWRRLGKREKMDAWGKYGDVNEHIRGVTMVKSLCWVCINVLLREVLPSKSQNSLKLLGVYLSSGI